MEEKLFITFQGSNVVSILENGTDYKVTADHKGINTSGIEELYGYKPIFSVSPLVFLTEEEYDVLGLNLKEG